MASSQPAKGRGRGRPSQSSATPPNPSITPSTDVSISTLSITEDTPPSASSPVDHEPEQLAPTTLDTGAHDTQPKPKAASTAPIGRGRTQRTKQNVVPDDPYWTVTNLTDLEFYSNKRSKKPDELGTLGEQIQVIANYFPILKFPFKGLVYKYQIQIRNRKNFEIPRERRRVIYNTWLQGLLRRNAQIDKHKIVFDNQARILAFDEPIPSIDENPVTETIMGPNRSNKQEPHTVIVQRVGTPVDLAMIQNLNQLFDSANESNERLEELQNIKQVLSIALHEHCSSHAAFIFNQTFYSATDGQYGDWDLGLGKAMWRGFYSCLVFGKGRYQLLMNLDVSHSVFMKKQPFLEFLCEVMLQSPSGKRDYGNRRNIRKVDGDDALRYLDIRSNRYQGEADFLLKQCKHVRVQSQNADKPIIYEISRLGLPAVTQEFEWKSNGNRRIITVQNYYKEHYNIDLQYPWLPVLETRNKSYLPMELVDVEPARVKKITDEQRALMCRYSSMDPNTYSSTINHIRKNPKQQCFEQDPFIAAWNFNIDVKMITVPARVLPMPEIVYDGQYRVTRTNVRDVGTWDLTKVKHFHKPADFPKVWAMINLTYLSQSACEEFFIEFRKVAEDRGMKCPFPDVYDALNAKNCEPSQLTNELERLITKYQDCLFFLVVLPVKTTRESKAAYRHIKKLCELEYGCGRVTQMLQETNVKIGTRKNPNMWDIAKLSNILLKINAKLNGVNSVLKVPDIISRFFSNGHRIMYVGADLSHPAPGNNNQTSVVAVVASADDIPNRFFKEIYKQIRPSNTRGESRDLIVSMKEIMKSLIQQYVRHRGFPPTAIVIYRDGISEGEFYSVFDKELTATRQACADLSPAYRPYLTYIVVNKRHRTRFFPTNPQQKNVSAGTVVDSHDITNATTYDFYLNSQHGALGTSRPTHYHVLYDDNKLKPDEVQMLTYALCYTYARCTRSVSVPAPVKYADLLAFRATLYLDIDDGSDTESVASGPRLPINQDTDIKNSIKSERIVLNSRLEAGCPFFL